MSTHRIEVSITPICTSCGAELYVGGAQSDVSRQRGVMDRDSPWERTEQRIFVGACDKCFVFAGDANILREALEKLTPRSETTA